MAKVLGSAIEIRCNIIFCYGNDDKGSKQVAQCEYDASPQTYAPSSTRMYLHAPCYECYSNGIDRMCCCHMGINTSLSRLTVIPNVMHSNPWIADDGKERIGLPNSDGEKQNRKDVSTANIVSLVSKLDLLSNKPIQGFGNSKVRLNALDKLVAHSVKSK